MDVQVFLELRSAAACNDSSRSRTGRRSCCEPNDHRPYPCDDYAGGGPDSQLSFLRSRPQFNLTLAGYSEEEFFIEGNAASYGTPALADAVLLSGAHNYRTSITVRRPIDPSKFNGIVLVEWVNVTAGYGIDVHWQQSREYLTREGYVHVAVQAQRVGVHQAASGLADPAKFISIPKGVTALTAVAPICRSRAEGSTLRQSRSSFFLPVRAVFNSCTMSLKR